MRITAMPARELTADMLKTAESWRARRGDGWESPFLSTIFLREVAAAREDAWAAWIECDGVPAGCLAFHRRGGGRLGAPLGLHLSDYQGLLCAAPLPVETGAVLAGAGLELMDCDHWVPGSLLGEPAWNMVDSPRIGVEGGYEALAEKLRARSSMWERLQKTRERLERDLGPIRFEAESGDGGVWNSLEKWKRAQYAATGAGDALAPGWVRELMERLRGLREPELSGTLSALWAGDRLLAAHFGMRGNGVWHYWFTAYDPEWARYSPGQVLLDSIARAAAEKGDRWIDLGKGDQPYKTAWATEVRRVGEGTMTRGGPVTAWRAGMRALKASPPGRWLKRRIRPAPTGSDNG